MGFSESGFFASDSDSPSRVSPGSWAGPREDHRVKSRERGCMGELWKGMRESCRVEEWTEDTELSIRTYFGRFCILIR